jgi:hypothetical protein
MKVLWGIGNMLIQSYEGKWRQEWQWWTGRSFGRFLLSRLTLWSNSHILFSYLIKCLFICWIWSHIFRPKGVEGGRVWLSAHLDPHKFSTKFDGIEDEWPPHGYMNLTHSIKISSSSYPLFYVLSILFYRWKSMKNPPIEGMAHRMDTGTWW